MPKAQDQCKRGHPYTEESTRWGRNPNGNPKRQCKICENLLARELRAARRKLTKQS